MRISTSLLLAVSLASVAGCVESPAFSLAEQSVPVADDAGDGGEANSTTDNPATPGSTEADAAPVSAPPGAVYSCGSGATCKCDDKGCSEACSAGGSCGPMVCGPQTCKMTCSKQSTCPVIDCTGADCAAECADGSTCAIDCTNAKDCAVRCKEGSACLVTCTGAASCAFAECSGGSGKTTCPNGTIVCNRPCP